jgi:hypothetical protein
MVYLKMDLEVGEMNLRMHITNGKRYLRLPTVLVVPQVRK